MSSARAVLFGFNNKLYVEDAAAHEWYRFVLSYPPHLVRDYVRRFGLTSDSCLLDPFCGTGTTIVEGKKLGIPTIGIEANRMAYFASKVKVDWSPTPDDLIAHAETIAATALKRLEAEGIVDSVREEPTVSTVDEAAQQQHPTYRTLPEDSLKLLLTDSISPLPLHKALILLDAINEHRDDQHHDHELLALAKALVFSISNLHFGPEVGVSKEKKRDAAVIASWLANVHAMANDLRELKSHGETPSTVYHADARQLKDLISRPRSIDGVITSPPYPNEKDYTRTTRLESVLLGFIKDKHELRALKRGLMRSNTRNVYKGDEDDSWVADNVEVQRIAEAIDAKRVELQKTSGFEKLYGKVTKLYFGGMAKHLAELRDALKPGAYLAYVVGDQASYFRVMIRTGQLLGDIAKSLGYQLVDIDLFRSRLATATKEQLREEVVILHWPTKTTRMLAPSKHFSEGTASMLKNEDVRAANRYAQIIERIFFSHYEEGATEVCFERTEIEVVARELQINLPKNIGDIVYSFRYRVALPETIRAKATDDKQWIIRPAGRSKYCFVLVSEHNITPQAMKAETKVPDATPGIIAMYRLNDEQALLARLRYNRLIDIFTGVTCYSLQNHLRTFLAGMGQVETDEIYIGVDKKGRHYVFPVQGKGGKDKLNIVQIEQDIALCSAKFPNLICRPIGAQFIDDTLIALFEFETTAEGVKLASEEHYRLVSPEEVTPDLLRTYQERLNNT